jgi:LmbE family N-acetylglucosaminyl deacetylase
VLDFRDSFFPAQWAPIKEAFRQIAAGFEPDLIFTHAREDRHQDHRVISELTWNTWRRHLILEYEIPKWDGDLGTPNVYVRLEEHHVRRKIEILLEVFASQRGKHWFDAETFAALLRLRGLEAATRYAEGFYGRKLVW